MNSPRHLLFILGRIDSGVILLSSDLLCTALAVRMASLMKTPARFVALNICAGTAHYPQVFCLPRLNSLKPAVITCSLASAEQLQPMV